tara:strand:+ start:447 stop:830 length:384 start_codon:yes stop_codon:yes gene_type:complete
MKMTFFIMMLLTSFATSAQTFFCAYKGTDGEGDTLQARVIIKEAEVELVRDTGDSFIYTTLFNKKQLLMAARPVYDKKRGRFINPGVDTLSLIIPTKGQAKNGARTQIKLGRVIQGLADSTSGGTCM